MNVSIVYEGCNVVMMISTIFKEAVITTVNGKSVKKEKEKEKNKNDANLTAKSVLL